MSSPSARAARCSCAADRLRDGALRARAALARDPELLGYAVMSVSALAHASLSFLVRLAATRYRFPVLSTLLIRSVLEGTASFGYVFAFVGCRRSICGISRLQWLLVFLRGVMATLSISCQITALALISTGDSVAILFTAPAITMVMAALVLHERIRRVHMIALALSFAGVLFVARPSFLSPSKPLDVTHQTLVGVLVAFAAAFFSSIDSVITRFLGHHVHFMLNVCSLSICTFLTAISLSGANEFRSIATNHAGLLINIIAGVCAALAQSTFSKGMQYCRAGPALLVRSLTVPFSFTYGLLFLGESPSLLTLFGVLMILSAVAVLGLSQLFPPKPPDETSPLTQH